MGLTISSTSPVESKSPVEASQNKPEFNALLSVLVALEGSFNVQNKDTYGALSNVEMLNTFTKEDNAVLAIAKKELQTDEEDLQALQKNGDPAAIQKAQEEYNTDVNTYNIAQQQTSSDDNNMQNSFETRVNTAEKVSQALLAEEGAIIRVWTGTAKTRK